MPRIAITARAICLLACLAPTGAKAQRYNLRNEPRPKIYRSSDGIWLVDLPNAMEDALDRYNRDFEPWAQTDYSSLPDYEPSSRQVPWAVIGDFNGDGRPDVAIAGRTDRDVVVVFVLSTGRSRYRVVEAERDPYDRDDPSSVRLPLLTYMYPGRYIVDDARLGYPEPLVVDQPAVQISGGRRQGAVIYVVQNNAVVPYYLSDRTMPPTPPKAQRPNGPPRPVSPIRPTTGNSGNP